MRVAAAAMKLRSVRGTGAYFAHLTDLVTQAHDAEASVLVLPELHCLELLGVTIPLPEHKVAEYLVQFADEIEDWFVRISGTSGLTIVSGSHLRREEDRLLNVGVLCRPGADPVRYEKNNLTRYEREMWSLSTGRGLVAADGLGMTVCYDSEFSGAGLALAEAGAWVQAVPAWTETVRGFQRVRWACLSRAVETTSYMVHASLIGDLGREPAPASYGTTAIIAPCVEPFAESAVLAETTPNEEGVVVADLDHGAILQARRFGEVTNWEDRAVGDWTVRAV